MKWIDRIKNAFSNGEFTTIDRIEAGDYKSCAVGERFEFIGMEYMAHNNLILQHLAYDFWCSVKDNDLERALEIYEDIQTFNRYKAVMM